MRNEKYKLGELLEQTFVTNSNLEFGINDVRGMTITKQIIPTKANMKNTELSKFIIVQPYDFIYNPRTHGKKIGLGYNDTDESFIISWNNIAFHIKPKVKKIILPDYLFLYFNRAEWDREACYRSWGSSTEVFSWDDMCDMEIDLPSVSIQKKYVDVCNAMITNQRTSERKFKDLNTVINANIEEFKHTAPRVAVGTLLEEVDVRNKDGKISNVQGININKEFIPSVANLSETDLTKYKVVSKNQFAANFMHVMRDEAVPFGLYNEDEPCIISPAYPVFKVKSNNVIAEYIMLWLNRGESDRYAWFISDSSIRGGLEMARFYDI